MEPKADTHPKITRMLQKGILMLNPLTLDVGEEVDIHRISARGVKIYPGCRIYGEKTVISEGAQLGREGPVTVENCWIGPKVELKGGYFRDSVFLEKASMGLAAHVREGCILEEEAIGAHAVGLKQTILFPFVTLGSLINFCDCLMGGGTSRKDHSEVGSSYIHFNFTPDGDKTTPSLVGDVPRGVMLNQRPVFLGGQGGMVGPLRLGFGNVVAAGTILRRDCLEENKLIIDKAHSGLMAPYVPYQYTGLPRLVSNNVVYLANLVALDTWYRRVRKGFFEGQELGPLVYEGAVGALALARKERITRLQAMAKRLPVSIERDRERGHSSAVKKTFHDNIEPLSSLFSGDLSRHDGMDIGRPFLEAFEHHRTTLKTTYIETIKSLPEPLALQGTAWLRSIVDRLCRDAAELLPALKMEKFF